MRNLLGRVSNDVVMFRKSFNELQVQIHVENNLPKWKSHKIVILPAQSGAHGRVPEAHDRVQIFGPFSCCVAHDCVPMAHDRASFPDLEKPIFLVFKCP